MLIVQNKELAGFHGNPAIDPVIITHKLDFKRIWTKQFHHRAHQLQVWVGPFKPPAPNF